MQATNLQKLGVGSFGAESSDSSFSARSLMESERYQLIDRREAYFACTQHDSKRFDFDGRICAVGSSAEPSASQPLIGEKFPAYVPLKSRKPAHPYRLGRALVSAFTNMVFGEQRFPKFIAQYSPERQDYVAEIARASQLSMRAIQGRNIAGSTGSVGYSWCFIDGMPRIEVHNPKNLFIHKWFDRARLIPRHVSEVYIFSKNEWDGHKKKYVTTWWWHRRDWTPREDILFKPARFERNEEPIWQPDLDASTIHNDNLTHFEWVQNTPSDEIDGKPDYDGLYEQMDSIDILYSVLVRGGVLNLDPTLKLKMDLDIVKRMGVRKGSDDALVVGIGGDASYMELAGTSITAGLALFESMRRSVLETSQCVVPDPDKVTAAGLSSVAQRLMYAPMLGRCDILREQNGAPIARMLEHMADVAKSYERRKSVMIIDGEPVEQPLVLAIPPKITQVPKVDETGAPTGETDMVLQPRDAGVGPVEAQWGPYFMPTPDDLSKQATTLSVATAQAAFISAETASEMFTSFAGRPPGDEWKRMQAANAQAEKKTASMFSDNDGNVGGKVEHTQQLPNGATVKRVHAPQPPPEPTPEPPEDSSSSSSTEPPTGALTPSDMAAIVTVNEARKSAGLDPIDGPEGVLTVAEYKAMRAKTVAMAANASLGTVGVTVAGAAAPKPGGPPMPGMPPGKGPPGAPPPNVPMPGEQQPGGAPPHVAMPGQESAQSPAPPMQKPPFPPKG